MFPFTKKKKTLCAIKKLFRATNYLSTTQIYLDNNFLMDRHLEHSDIKVRLLGHWGTCPGINFVYTHLNSLITDTKQKIMFLIGSGHGFPALQANLFLERSLERFYGAEYKHSLDGVEKISRLFSVPYGFPSHSNPISPGVILEGGELGYALSTAFGSVLDKPNLVSVALIGDGEAETGPTAAAWHLSKFLTKNDGVVLPILHLNGYKISGPTIFGRMNDDELENLFSGYGYNPHFVDHEILGDDDIHSEMYDVLRDALAEIDEIKSGRRKTFQKYPMIILRTPKGWTGPESDGEKKIANNHYSHQVVYKNARKDESSLKKIESWLVSYKFFEIFHPEKGFDPEILSIIPGQGMRIGDYAAAHDGARQLTIPKNEEISAELKTKASGNSMRLVGKFITQLARSNRGSFRLFSPDETYSNRIDEIFSVTKRAWMLPQKEWDQDLSTDGRVIELLSEHSLQGMMQGYILMGGSALFVSYEAFVQIVSSMADQYIKFLKIAREVRWRKPVASMNYILTSSLWHQEHNGFSHQNPGFVHEMLSRQAEFVQILFPSDAHITAALLEQMFTQKNTVNIMCVGKKELTIWLSPAQAKKQSQDGIMIWEKYSDKSPDIVFGASGDYVTAESIMAMKILRKKLPKTKMRFVNITSLNGHGIGNANATIEKKAFEKFFPKNIPIIYSFHGYPETLESIFFKYDVDTTQLETHGYRELGSTTTPFDMLVRNRSDRYSLVQSAAKILCEHKKINKKTFEKIFDEMESILLGHERYIKKHFDDDPAIVAIKK